MKSDEPPNNDLKITDISDAMMLELKHVQSPYDPQWNERVYNPGGSRDDLGIEINLKSGEGIYKRALEQFGGILNELNDDKPAA